MTDPDRERETVHDTERTTIIQTDGGRDRGGGGVLLAVVLILVLLAILYFVFSGSFNRAADSVGVNVNVETPKVQMPNVNLPDKIEVNMPDKIDVSTDGDGNKAK
jgi:flagellar basal body-associated protein FliL